MHFVEKEPPQKRMDLDEKLKSNKILRVPGAYNPLTAKLIEEIGYDAVYVSGGVMANDLGFPDIGLTTLQDVSTRSYLISRVTNLPTIVDIDTGFKSCKETIETFEQFGISAVHLEDQIERKRCGHLDNKELISTDAMVKKIKECVSAKKDKNFKIIARSDAKSVEGIDKMIERCKAYIDAGAEIVFPEALSDEKDFEKVRKELLKKMGQKTLTIELQDEIIKIPDSLSKYDLNFGANKMSLIYTYNLKEKQTGITNLLQDIKDAGLKLRDLKTEQSNLEKIFVSLVRENNEI